jgi:hypothetical protein
LEIDSGAGPEYVTNLADPSSGVSITVLRI